jgi:serine/threonine protein kinase
VRVGGSSIQRSPVPHPSPTPKLPRVVAQAATERERAKLPPRPASRDQLDEFIHRVVQSGLLTQGDVQQVMHVLAQQGRKRSVNELATELIKQEKLTMFQTKEICAGRGNNLILGNYVVMEKLGDGGMGLVVKAHHRRMDRTVALKLLSPTLIKTPEAVGRFHREAKAAAKLDHQNIVTAYDADECAGTHFLVMQYVDGSDLSAIVREKGPLAPEVAVSCIEQAARGLQYAHRQGVVHRDIKPSNLLMDKDGAIRILDMGLARIDTEDQQEQDQLTGTGMIMGTVDFMAPEQAADTKTVDGRADIYSLGTTLWFLLTGRVMYDSDTLIKKLMAHQNAPIPSLIDVCPAVSPELQRVFSRMVAKDADDRYQSMSDVLDALEEIRDLRAGMSAGRSAARGSNTSVLKNSARELLQGLSPEAGAHAVVMQLDESSAPALDVTVTMQASQEETERELNAPRPKASRLQARHLEAPQLGAGKRQSPKSKTLTSPHRWPRRQTVRWSIAAGAVAVLVTLVIFWLQSGNG